MKGASLTLELFFVRGAQPGKAWLWTISATFGHCDSRWPLQARSQSSTGGSRCRCGELRWMMRRGVTIGAALLTLWHSNSRAATYFTPATYATMKQPLTGESDGRAVGSTSRQSSAGSAGRCCHLTSILRLLMRVQNAALLSILAARSTGTTTSSHLSHERAAVGATTQRKVSEVDKCVP